MSCIVREERPLEPGLRRWILSSCSGERTSRSGALEVAIDSSAGVLLAPSQRVTVHALLQADHDDHKIGYAWSILDEGGVLIAAAASFGGFGPEMLGTSSLRTVEQPCVKEGACLSDVTPLSVEFEHNGVLATIPQGRRERVGGEPTFDVTVPRAEMVTGASCGIFANSSSVQLTVSRIVDD